VGVFICWFFLTALFRYCDALDAGGFYNTAACGWDGGDCCVSTCVNGPTCVPVGFATPATIITTTTNTNTTTTTAATTTTITAATAAAAGAIVHSPLHATRVRHRSAMLSTRQ
jgi:hypothetical protein